MSGHERGETARKSWRIQQCVSEGAPPTEGQSCSDCRPQTGYPSRDQGINEGRDIRAPILFVRAMDQGCEIDAGRARERLQDVEGSDPIAAIRPVGKAVR